MEEQEDSLIPTQASIVFSPFQDHSVHWGRGPVVLDLSQSDHIENCHMQKEHLTTVCNKLWPRMIHLFEGNIEIPFSAKINTLLISKQE